MIGNAWDWCLNEYEVPKNTTLVGEGSRTLRGGAWRSTRYIACVTHRGNSYPSDRLNLISFRVVRLSHLSY